MPLDLIYAGTPAFAVPALQRLVADGHRVLAVYTQPDRPAGRGRRLTASAVKQAAQALAIPVRQPESLKTPSAQTELAAFGATAMVVAAYGYIEPGDDPQAWGADALAGCSTQLPDLILE